MKTLQNKLIDALNRLEELAANAAQGSNDVEVEILKDYNLLFNFLNNDKPTKARSKKNPK